MEKAELIRALHRDVTALATAADQHLTRSVSSCPGWTMSDLVWHTTRVHNAIVQIIRDGVQGFDKLVPVKRADDDELIKTYSAGLQDLIDVATQADPTAMIWSWTGPVGSTWAVRRMTQETAVHAWDAANAVGTSTAIEAALAGDGIDEFLSNFLPRGREGVPAVGGSVHIHCTDVAGEWTITQPDARTFVVTREHAKGTCAIRGAASDVLLALWRRLPLSQVEIIGDAGVAQRFIEHTAL